MKTIFLILIPLLLSANIYDISFIVLNNGKWKITVCKNKKCKILNTQEEPRTFDYDFIHDKIVYIASDKSVRLVVNGKEKKILESNKDSYTDPLFVQSGKKIILVKLINGNSKNTKIISVNLDGKNEKTLVFQHSTALNPYSIYGKIIYYANVSCVEGCGKIIQEIWEKDIVSGQAKQLTLLNTLSHQPSNYNNFIYFSSFNGKNYHIWQLNSKDGKIKQLTFGNVTDSFPCAYKDGVFFIRRINDEVNIMHLSKNKKLKKFTINLHYQKIRNLRIKK